MVPLKDKKEVSFQFINTGLIFLVVAVSFGVLGALQYIITGLFRDNFSFAKVRPLHVSSAVFWILITSCGVVLYYMKEVMNSIWSRSLARWQLIFFLIAMISILCSYILGIFGGREYWEFPPVLAIPFLFAWILFTINVFKSVRIYRRQPVYIWMWLTGAVYFLFSFLESYLWLIPNFRANIVSDMTIQWKSYGSMVGGWNMLIYGSSIYLMDKISGTKQYSYSKIAFLLYFLGLFNLMFNWGHHIYTLPTPKFIQYISYLVSMTELLILGRIIYNWRASLNTATKYYNILPFRFLFAADIWIFLTLLLAIGMSIPSINAYTHGTHITVGHTMGATIGINTFLLLAYVTDIFKIHKPKAVRRISTCLHIALVSLFVFWISLIIAGVIKADWQMHHPDEAFSIMMYNLRPYFITFFISGTILATCFIILVLFVFKYSYQTENNNE
ncbi:MAG: cbb3-type cytochrome c oxidase subunit I [Saprospiraceae bacterium]|nr:cbb3-type cytochrome c oxidase subunit I [Saprospiraceae bacterium]